MLNNTYLFITDRQTDRQTNSLTPYTEVCGFFLTMKFATTQEAKKPARDFGPTLQLYGVFLHNRYSKKAEKER